MSERGVKAMGLKAPNILTFMLSVILTMAVLFTIFFKAEIPLINEGGGFWALLVAQVVLILGCTMRGL
jgi:phosphatidylglycerophosphate synthase